MRDYGYSYDPGTEADWEQIRERLRSENGVFNVVQKPEENRIILTAHPGHWDPETLSELVPLELEYLGEEGAVPESRPSRSLSVRRSKLNAWTLRDPERVPRIEENLETIEGVSSARVNFADRVVRVEYDPERCTETELEDHLVREGVRPGTVHRIIAVGLIAGLVSGLIALVWFVFV